MENIIYFILVFNILNFAGFSAGKHFLDKKYHPHFISKYAMLIAGLLILYLIGNLYLSIYFFNLKKIFLGLIPLIFIFLPFVYGKLSNYKTSNYYINLQILTFFINSIFILGIILKFS